MLACLAYSTVVVPKTCTVATDTISFPCTESKCPGGCATSYIYSLTWSDPTVTVPTTTPTPTDGGSCHVR